MSFLTSFFYCFFNKDINVDDNEIKKYLCQIYDMMDGSHRKKFSCMREKIEQQSVQDISIFLSYIYDINLIVNNKIYFGFYGFDLYKPFIILNYKNNKYVPYELNNEVIFHYPKHHFLFKIYYEWFIKKEIYNQYKIKLNKMLKWDKQKILNYSNKLNIDIHKYGKKKKMIKKNKKELLEEIFNKL